MDATKPPRYHVVCRDCPVERLFDNATDADAFELNHVTATGHTIAVGQVG